MKKSYQGSIEEIRALSTYVKLMRATESVTARIHRHLADVGLTISQFGVLDALFHIGPLNQGEIGKKILKTSGNITMIVDNLEKRGLVKRTRIAEDRRVVSVQLTENGHLLMKKVFPKHAAIVAEKMGVLSSSEQDKLGRLCKKLGLGLSMQE